MRGVNEEKKRGDRRNETRRRRGGLVGRWVGGWVVAWVVGGPQGGGRVTSLNPKPAWGEEKETPTEAHIWP